MFEVDRITESGRRTMVGILNKSIQIEYRFIMNYPRLIDQLVNIDRIPNEQVPKDLERLGKESIQHAGWTERLIQILGYEPELRFSPIDRMIDVPGFLLLQLELERLAQSLFGQAKSVAEQNQVKGIGAKIKAWLTLGSGGVAERNDIIRMLGRLAHDEQTHIELIERMIPALNIQTQK